jgi:hypothetical protein
MHEHVHQQVVDGAAQQFLVADRGQDAGDLDAPADLCGGDFFPAGPSLGRFRVPAYAGAGPYQRAVALR